MCFRELICYLYIWCIPFVIMISMAVSTNIRIIEIITLDIILLLPFVIFKTIRRLLVKELFKMFYSTKYSINWTRGGPVGINGNTVCFLPFLLTLMVMIIFFPLIAALKTSLWISVILLLGGSYAVYLLIYKLLKRHFENPLYITRYYPLYWHCQQIFETHSLNKRPRIPKAKCIWIKINSEKIPYMYFDTIFWGFIMLIIIFPYIVWFIFNIPLEEQGKYILFKHVINSIKNWCHSVYTLHGSHFVIDIIVFLSILLYTWYIRKILHIIIQGNNKSKQAESTYNHAGENTRIYIKTISRKEQQVSFVYALKWSIPIVTTLYVFHLINNSINGNWLPLIDVIYVCAFLYIIYIALNRYVNKCADVYIKIFYYKDKRFEFYKLTDNWKW